MAAGIDEANSWDPPASEMARDRSLQIPCAAWCKKSCGSSGMEAVMTAEAAAARAKVESPRSHASSAAREATARAARSKAVLA